jgi:hypothetical protein
MVPRLSRPSCARESQHAGRNSGALRLLCASAVFFFAPRANAQEIRITGPLAGCPGGHYHPARLEWAVWNSAGVVVGQDGPSSATAGIGTEVTARLSAFPRGFEGLYPDDPELRGGLFASAETRSSGALVETGLTAHLRTDRDAFVELRGGGGYASYDDRRSAHVGAALALGARFVLERLQPLQPNTPCSHERQSLADVTFARFVLSYRRTTDFSGWEMGIGLEVTPTLVVLPRRLAVRR